MMDNTQDLELNGKYYTRINLYYLIVFSESVKSL